VTDHPDQTKMRIRCL